MEMIDLHVHSTCSDGTFTPDELILHAQSKGLKAIALTDHDTLEGIATCQAKGKEIGIEVIPGIECSADYYGRELHILGYYIDPNCKMLIKQLKTLVSGRQQRNLQILDKLRSLGLPLTEADLLEGYPPHTIVTRAHFAAAMLRKGYVADRKEAFSKYLTPGKPAYVPRKKFTVKECITLIHQAGGLAVLAHPLLYGFSKSEVTQLLRSLAQDGLDGAECLYSTHNKEDITHLLQVCSNLKLFPTGGSDFHGANKPHLDLGTGYGNLTIPYDLLLTMKKRLGYNDSI